MNEEEQVAAPPDQPPYLHIADVLRDEIQQGVFRVGERLPSQADLEKRFEVSRPTIQRALSQLRRDGYLDNQRGRSAEVLDWRAAGRVRGAASDTPGPTFRVLDTEVEAAFEADHVKIDVYSLSAETLSTALAAPLNRVLRGELTPQSVRVRLLLPSLDARLAIPRMVDGDDDWPLQRLRELVNAQMVSLNSAFNQVIDLRRDLDLTMEVRAVPVTPLHKLYVLNDTTALTGQYRVVRRHVRYRDHEGEIYDVLGIGSVLFPYRADGDPNGRASRFVEESRTWFDSLWSTIAAPARPLG